MIGIIDVAWVPVYTPYSPQLGIWQYSHKAMPRQYCDSEDVYCQADDTGKYAHLAQRRRLQHQTVHEYLCGADTW